jgi:hypothetical protein
MTENERFELVFAKTGSIRAQVRLVENRKIEYWNGPTENGPGTTNGLDISQGENLPQIAVMYNYYLIIYSQRDTEYNPRFV